MQCNYLPDDSSCMRCRLSFFSVRTSLLCLDSADDVFFGLGVIVIIVVLLTVGHANYEFVSITEIQETHVVKQCILKPATLAF